jgi:hypothetical protein
MVYVTHDSKTWGPYDTLALQKHVNDRKFLPTDLANVVGSDNWQPLNTIASFPVEAQVLHVHHKEKKIPWISSGFFILFGFFVIAAMMGSDSEKKSVTGSYHTSNSEWDSSVPCIEGYVKDYLSDPDSYKSHKWSEVQDNGDGTYSVTHEYGAKNGFGAMVRETKKFTYDSSGTVTNTIPARFSN